MELVVLNLTTPSINGSYVHIAHLLLVVGVLLGAGVFVPPASAEPPLWRTSHELIKQSPKSFPRLDKAGIEAIVKRLPKALSLIDDYLLDKDAAVFLHKGDLTIDRSFDNSHILVVDGNLTIRGSYDDYRDGIGIIVVLGDMRAEHVVSWGSIAVAGTLQATGLVYAYYNDFTFEVGGPVKARALVTFDKATNYDTVDALFEQSDNGEGTALAVRHFVPELMIEDVLDKTDAETTELYAVASYEAARKRIEAGQPLFRDKPGSESLAKDVLRLFAPKLDGATMAKLAKADPLLAMIVATKETVPADVQKQLAATGDPTILELLSKNPKADRSVLAQTAGKNAAIAANVAKNPNAPPEALASLASSSDPAVRIALLENPAVAATALSRLAVDKDVTVRKALAEGRHVRRLPAADLAKLIADPDVNVRAALPRHDAVLSLEQLAVLARDKSPVVRQAVGRALSDQALWNQVPVGTPEARTALMATLLADALPEVRVSALPGASADAHEQFVDKLVPGDRSRGDAELAPTTRSEKLMMRAAAGDQDGARELAENPAITPAVQLQLINKLENVKTRPRVSSVDIEGLLKEALSWDIVVDQLMQNPNVTAEALMAAAKYCRAANGRPGFCNSLLNRRDLSAAIFDTLDGVGDREDWALSVVLGHYSTRAQLQRAVPLWYDNEPEVRAEFEKLRSLKDAAWWNALATSKQVKLREIAAINVATAPAALTTLLRDKEGDIAGHASANPSTPIEALSPAIAGSSWVLNNPRVPDALVRQLLDRALAEDEPTVASECKKVLAARALRAAR
jgi:hypothetical protein